MGKKLEENEMGEELLDFNVLLFFYERMEGGDREELVRAARAVGKIKLSKRLRGVMMKACE